MTSNEIMSERIGFLNVKENMKLLMFWKKTSWSKQKIILKKSKMMEQVSCVHNNSIFTFTQHASFACFSRCK